MPALWMTASNLSSALGLPVAERVPAALLRSPGDHAGYPRDGTPEVGSARLVPRVADNLMLVAGEQPCQKNGVVVSDEEKARTTDQAGIGKASASEPLMKCRDQLNAIETGASQ
jgi:hypothetical protein